MSGPDQPSPSTSTRLHDWWRGLWGRGDSRLSTHLETELAHQLMLDTSGEHSGDPRCAICQLRARGCQNWISNLPLGPDQSAGTRAAAILPYCPRHLRLLVDAADGQRHLRELLPDLLAVAHDAVHAAGETYDFAPIPPGCSVCAHEDQIETQAVHAAAQLPPSSTGTLPGLPRLDLCHEHTLLIAARIVGRLGPEPRAIPELHMLLSSHRRQLRHLIAGDRLHAEQLGRALVAVCDADVALPQPRLGLSNTQSPAPQHCTVCTAAASDTRALLAEMTERLLQAPRQLHHQPNVCLCRVHLRDLLNHARREDDTDDPTLLASIAQTQLTQLAPALGWLDSGFGHPHTIRHNVSELVAPRSCPACATYLEGQRDALASLTARSDSASDADRQDAAICLRHSTSLSAEYPARIALADALRTAHALLQELPAPHSLAVATACGVTVPAPGPPTGRNDAPPHPVLISALGLLDGRIHHDTAGAPDAPIP